MSPEGATRWTTCGSPKRSRTFSRSVRAGRGRRSGGTTTDTTNGRGWTIGRSFHDGVQPAANEYDVTEDTDKGLYFEQQWQRALEVDPEFVFVTGWNEWTAGQMTRRIEDYAEEMARWDFFPGADCGKCGRKVEMGESYFIDQYNQEFSRDIEPMKGGHGDNYYYQLMANVRRYKGVEKPEPAGEPFTIDIDGGFDQWTAMRKTYYDHRGDTYHRDSPGNFSAGPYVDTTGRNDIVESKVARDDKYVYFYAKTADKLTPCTDPFWMLLFIDADGLVSEVYKDNPPMAKYLLSRINSHAFLSRADIQPEIASLIRQILDVMRRQEELYLEEARGLAFALLICLARQNTDGSQLPGYQHSVNSNIVISPALVLINNEPGQPFKISELAKICHISETHFRRVFSEYMKMSTVKYINQVRIRQACDDLKRSNDSINVIAARSGFPSLSTFNRNFRQITGVTPQQLRKHPELYVPDAAFTPPLSKT